MKFVVYEVREDEKKMLRQLEQEHGLELVLTPETLRPETAALAEGAQGVSTLGHSVIDRAVLGKLTGMGIYAYSARCIGVNHID